MAQRWTERDFPFSRSLIGVGSGQGHLARSGGLAAPTLVGLPCRSGPGRGRAKWPCPEPTGAGQSQGVRGAQRAPLAPLVTLSFFPSSSSSWLDFRCEVAVKSGEAAS